MTGIHRRRKYLVEGLVIALFVVALAFTLLVETRAAFARHAHFSQPAIRELSAYEKYGPDRASQFHEEWLIRDFFQDRRDGFFLDVGANHFRHNSTTHFLEVGLGWTGIAVEPLSEFAADYKVHRPRTRFVAAFASDVPDSRVKFFVPKDKLVASSNQEFTARYGAAGAATEVPATTLTAILTEAGVHKIDFLSMDIELAEPKALAGFDIDRFRPALVCIEAHPEVRQQILDYFAAHRYVVVGKYLRADPHNLYFQPLSSR
jgi:FkbM family methyltransferase